MIILANFFIVWSAILSCFCKFGIDGNPESKIGHQILVRDGQKAEEQKFDFQGSQILLIRVAVPLVDVEIGFENGENIN